MAELVDARDSKSRSSRSESSILSSGTSMHIFFDLLITIGIVITALPAVILLYSRSKRKKSWEYNHKKLSLLLSLILLLGTTILLYGSFVEPQLLITNYYEVDLDNIEEEIKIAFVADYQLGIYKQTDWTNKTVDRILELEPDIILLGGDNVDNANYNLEELTYLEPLARLAKIIPTYAIQGNHEYGVGGGKSIYNSKYRVANMSQETKKKFTSLGIKTLENELEVIEINNSKFYLFGADSFWAGKLNYKILEKRNLDIPTIAMIHNPAFYIKSYPEIDLVLSGHTHGGQIRLPFVGPLGKVDDILPSKYYQGLHELDTGTKLLVTSGIGETGTRARLFNPPEIVMITIN